jgi:hypothetical protein
MIQIIWQQLAGIKKKFIYYEVLEIWFKQAIIFFKIRFHNILPETTI